MTLANIPWPNSVPVLSYSELFDKVFSQFSQLDNKDDNYYSLIKDVNYYSLNKDVNHYSLASRDTHRQCENIFRERWELLKNASRSSLSPYKIDYHFTKIEDDVNVLFPESSSFYAKCRKLIKILMGDCTIRIFSDSCIFIRNNTLLSTACPIGAFEQIIKKAQDRALIIIWPRLSHKIFEIMNAGLTPFLSDWVKGRELLIGMSNPLDVILPPSNAEEETVRSFFNHPSNISVIEHAIMQFLSATPINASAEEIRIFLNHPAIEFVLEKIPVLRLNGLRLNEVPHELNLLKNLGFLDLSNNRLNDFPDLHFKELHTLKLEGNDLTEILSINHLPKLENLKFDCKASMFISDEIFQKIPTLNGEFSYSDGDCQKFSTCSSPQEELNYRCESALALLWQSFFKKDFSIEEMKLLVTALTPNDRNLIYEMIWEIDGKIINGDPQWGEHHAFDTGKMFRFPQAVKSAISKKLGRLSQEQRNKVYGHIYELAGRPQTADRYWGECNATALLTRLADALARIESNNPQKEHFPIRTSLEENSHRKSNYCLLQ